MFIKLCKNVTSLCGKHSFLCLCWQSFSYVDNIFVNVEFFLLIFLSSQIWIVIKIYLFWKTKLFLYIFFNQIDINKLKLKKTKIISWKINDAFYIKKVERWQQIVNIVLENVFNLRNNSFRHFQSYYHPAKIQLEIRSNYVKHQ